jgi:AraC-like DNA-binding protein
MQYTVYSPSGLLSPYVKYYWTLEDSSPGNRERIFPDGCMELIFHYGDLFKKYSNFIDANNQPRSFIHGQLKSFIEVKSTGRIGVFSVRFKPDGLSAFLRVSVDELSENVVSVEDLWGPAGRTLEAKMVEAPSSFQRIRIIEEFLISHLQTRRDQAIHYCVHAIASAGHSQSIAMLSKEVSLSRRQLERKFISAVGVSPKFLTRIVRFQNVLQCIERDQLTSLTGIAHSGGFFDQSHFIRDFKEFTGLSPRQYFTSKLELAKQLAAE